MENRIRQFIQKPEKKTMTAEAVRGLAEANQVGLIQWPIIFYWGSGHQFDLIVKK
jgi:hypothetical protein